MVSVTSVMNQYARDFIPPAFAPVLDEALKATEQMEPFNKATTANDVAQVKEALRRRGYADVALRLDRNMPYRFSP